MAGALIAPGQLLMAFIVLFPAAIAIYIGFTSWAPTTGDDFWHAYRTGTGSTATGRRSPLALLVGDVAHGLITVVAVAVEFGLGFVLALLLLQNFRGRGLVTVFFLLPMMVVPAVSGFIFFMLFQLDGPVNEALAIFAPGEPIAWLQNPDLAIWSVMIVDIWQWTPLMFLIFLSGWPPCRKTR